MSSSTGYSTPVQPFGTGVYTRRSLGALRRMLAQSGRLQSLTLVTTTSNGPADGKGIISDQLGGTLDTDAYRGQWVMPTQTGADAGASAGAIRRIANQGLNTLSGALTPIVAWPAMVPAGVDVELHRLLPPVGREGYRGLRECLNLALQECWFPQRLPLVGVNGQADYSLSTYAEWLDPQAIMAFRDPASSADLWPTLHPGWTVYRDAQNLTLQVAPTLAAQAGYSLEATRPGDTYIAVGGVWGDSTTGLVNDTDEQLFQPSFLVEIALVHAYEALASAGDKGAEWADLAQKQRVRANWLKLTYLVHPNRQQGVQGPVSYVDPKDFASWPVY